MLRLLILASLGAVINASLLPNHFLDYPRSLQRLFGIKRETTDEEKAERQVCQTSECKTIANLLKSSMDENIDPCDDFYEFACGKWSSNNPLPENKTEWSLWIMVSEKVEGQVQSIIETKPKPNDLFAVKLAKKWYESCMDTDKIEERGAEPILSTLWRHGGWPLIMEEGEWDDRIYHWQIVDDHFARLLGFNAFHDVRYTSLTYEGNDTILIDTPHLPLGIPTILMVDSIMNNADSSDENNVSGEGSQEAGSKERTQEQQNENEVEEEGEEEEEENGNEFVKKRNHKRFGKKHIAKHETKKRTKRDILKNKIVRRLMHQLKKANKHKVKLSKHGHLSLANGKSTMKKKNHENKRIAKGKNNKRLGHAKRKNNKHRAMQKHVHERNMKRKLKVRNNQHHARMMNNHRLHHAMNKMKLANRKKMIAENGTEDDEMDNNIDPRNDSDDGNKNEENNEVDTGDAEKEENDNDIGNNDDDDEKEQNEDDEEKDEEENKDENDEEKKEDEEEKDEEDEDDSEEVDIEMLREEYKEYILNVSLILSEERGIKISREILMKDINDLLEFAIKVAELTFENEEPVSVSLRTLQDEYDNLETTTRNGKINWVKKVQKIFAEAGVDIEDDVEVTVSNPDYFKKLHALLDKTPSKTIVNYIHWAFVSMAILAGPEKLRTLSENWFPRRAFFSSRSSECIQLVDITEIVAYEYVQQYFSEETAKTARDMIDDIQKEVEYQIKESTWMDEETKHFILDKLVNMNNLVGYPSWYKNTTAVKAYFQGLTIGPSYYENLLNYIRHMKWKNLRRILENSDESVEYLDPLMLNAFFIPTENSISITAADFQSPLFALNRPWAVNFGIIGLVMGHEVNHGFDNEGHLYDHGGKLMEWLSAMADAYNKRAECFVDQFNHYSIIKGENYTIENYGNQTAGENIADTMGLQAVYRAYKRRERECGNPDPALPELEKFSNDQIFFLSFANLWCESTDRETLIRSTKFDVHSPGRLRVIGSVSNSEDFAKAFNCPVGSPMNPKKKCNIWV